jgi:hypothetical protein
MSIAQLSRPKRSSERNVSGVISESGLHLT